MSTIKEYVELFCNDDGFELQSRFRLSDKEIKDIYLNLGDYRVEGRVGEDRVPYEVITKVFASNKKVKSPN